MDEAGIVAPRGGNGCEVPLSMSATSSSDASPSPINANESNGPSSRRPRRTLGSRMSFKTSLLVLITAGATAAVILHGHRYPSASASIINIKATVSEHLTTLQQKHPALNIRLPSVQNSPWPRISREFIKGSKAAAASLQTQTLSFTAESAELAWEKSENAYSQLRHLEEEEEENEEVVSTTKENNWIEGIFHLRRGVGGNANNNLRRKEGRNTNVSNNNNNKQHRQQQRNTNKENNHRRTTMKANNDHHDEHSNAAATTTNGQEKGGLLIMEFISKSPMAASLLAFCTLLFLGGSFIVSSSSNHSEMLFRRNSLLLDENEAEIVEFYEKEMEGGMLSQQHPSVPLFDHHDHHHLLSDHDDNEGGGGTITHHPAPILKRASTGGSTDIRLMKNSPERNQSDSCLSRTATRLSYNHHHHVRSSSDSALSRHLFIGGESSSTLLKGSKCDLYYSRVLQDIETLDYEDDVVEDLQVDNDVAEAEGGEAMIRNGREDAMELGDQECQFTLMENLSSLSEEKDDADADRIVKGDGTEDVQTSTAAPPATPSHPQTTVSGEGEDDTCFESAHSEEREDSRPQSPQSQSSSISSLTSEGYDIESPFRGSSKEEKEEVPNNNKVTTNNEGKSLTPLYGTAAIVMPSSSQPQEPIPKAPSCGATTPPTSNLHKRHH